MIMGPIYCIYVFHPSRKLRGLVGGGGGGDTRSIVYKVLFYVRGWKNINTWYFSLIEELNKLNDVNTMYMYSLLFYGIIPSKLLLYVTFWH